ncbi:WD-40 repeat-containing protein [Dunaliella salina]|uniref:WD-40 repeat-containing protein n=1 Tax=Dunaliella salina TaxID=3046 RepID=A0ABQ7G9I6_DUNSA|nr:WD-40 repeat-containing protein [Dunaliella salina]|eukprot:KAF5831269.1 WD-40 repeat-containing protein [Dunaliella salina]
MLFFSFIPAHPPLFSRLWDVRSGNSIAKLEGHSDAVSSVVFSADGAYVLSGSADETIRVWDTNTKTCKRTMTGHKDWVWCVVLTPDGAYAVSGSSDKTIRLWTIAS